jgi:hypothetical protein
MFQFPRRFNPNYANQRNYWHPARPYAALLPNSAGC